MTEEPPSNVQTPEHSAAAGCVPVATVGGAQLMTQSVQRSGTKRKLNSRAAGLAARAGTPDHNKRLRIYQTEPAHGPQGAEEGAPCSTGEGAGQDGTGAEEASDHQELQQRNPGEPGKEGNAVPSVASPPSRNRTMLQVVFSPLFSVFRSQTASASAAAAAAAAVAAAVSAEPAKEDAGAAGAAGAATAATATPLPEPAGLESSSHALAKGAAAGPGSQAAKHHAHHPPAPAVPEAAESEVEDPAQEEEEDDDEEFDPLLFIRSLPPLEQCIPKHRRSLLPSKTRQCKRKTLVLDLDETLVHSTLEPSPAPGGGAGAGAAGAADFSFEVHFNNQTHMIHVRRRPHLAEFMASVAALFEVVVFTASLKLYAEKLLNVIDPKRCLIKHRVFRDSCVIVDGNYLKDLTCLGRDMSACFIVDNSPQAFGFQPDNGIPIESWYDDEEDTELLKLLPFLQSLADDGVEDVRPHIASKFRLKELISSLPG